VNVYGCFSVKSGVYNFFYHSEKKSVPWQNLRFKDGPLLETGQRAVRMNPCKVRKTCKMEDFTKYIKSAKDLGVKEAKIISSKSIVAAEWVRLKCQFGCDGYGRTLTCPPYSPTPEQTRGMISYYEYALLVHGDEYAGISNIVSRLEREIFLDGYYKAFGMGAGPCNLCDACPKFCRHPERARPSMEACGIDVYSTVRANGFPIEVLKTNSWDRNYYGVVLIQ